MRPEPVSDAGPWLGPPGRCAVQRGDPRDRMQETDPGLMPDAPMAAGTLDRRRAF
ncbi:MAG: hypothetical protein INR63_18215 [Actinomycetospora chiangmaiensis]|nr:hypothetical protein [Actinomycetospora chiangmaiensis]